MGKRYPEAYDVQGAVEFAREVVELGQKAEFYGQRLSEPNERQRNLAACFLRMFEDAKAAGGDGVLWGGIPA